MTRCQHHAFTLIELLAVIAVMAALIVGALFFTGSYVAWARQTAAKQTYTVLNDALTRYKGEGGNISALTVGAPMNDIFAAMQTQVTWAGNIQHQFMKTGYTYPGRSILAVGTGAQYQFAQVDNYKAITISNSSTPTSQYPYGQGYCYMANGSASSYPIYVHTTTGYFAYKGTTGAAVGQAMGDFTIAATASLTIWSCVSAANTTPSGSITKLGCGGCMLTSLNVSGLTSLTYLDCNSNNLASLNLGGLNLNYLDCSNNLLSSLTFGSFQSTGTFVDVSGNPICSSANGTNAIYSGLSTVTSGSFEINDNCNDNVGNTAIPMGKGWSIINGCG